MIYLTEEKILFAKVQDQFSGALAGMQSQMAQVYGERGDRMDVESPIHHRLSPEGMLHEVKKKAGRIEVTLSHPNWSEDQRLLGKIVEECVDMANYACFLGALAILLHNEAEEGDWGKPEPDERGVMVYPTPSWWPESTDGPHGEPAHPKEAE